jgi:hypothetical protein
VDSIESNASKNSSIVAYVFVAAVMFLQSRCLATIENIHTNTQIDGRFVKYTAEMVSIAVIAS